MRRLGEQEVDSAQVVVSVYGPTPTIAFNRLETFAVFLTVAAILVIGCMVSDDSVLTEAEKDRIEGEEGERAADPGRALVSLTPSSNGNSTNDRVNAVSAL